MATDKLIEINVIPRSSRTAVAEENGTLKVYVTSAPEKGKANAAVKKALSEYWSISKSRIEIVSGLASRQKRIRIHTD